MKGKTENEEEGAKGVVTLEELKKKMADFAKEREWDQFHTPRNLLLAMKCWQECVRCSYAGVNNFGLLPDTPTQVGEVGELSEIFQWKGEVPRGLPDWAEKEKQHLGEELSDVLLYLVRLSDICGIDLGNAVLRKLELNAIKYPVSLCKGSSKKLTLLSKSTTTTTTTTTSSSENGVINDGE